MDKKVNQRLQLEENLTLEKATQVARQSEDIRNQNIQQAVARVQFRRRHPEKLHSTERSDQRGETSGCQEQRPFKCYFCGNSAYHRRSQCPALKSKCTQCSRIGHWAKVCNKKKVNAIVETSTNNDNASSDDTFFLNSVDKISQETSWIRSIRVNNRNSIQFKIDTGADVTVLPPGMSTSFKIRRFQAWKTHLLRLPAHGYS